MRKHFILGMVAISALSLSSCTQGGNFLDDPRPVADPFFVAESDTVEVEAATFNAGESITGILRLKSNVSWSGALADTTANWLSVEQQSDINLSGLTKNYAIPVSFFENEDNSSREAVINFYSKGGSSKTLIRQKAFVPVLKIEGKTLPDTIPASGGKYELQIISNTYWEAEMPLGASAVVALSDSSGVKSNWIGVTVEENTDTELEASSQIKFAAEGCSDLIIKIIQNKATL